MAPPRKTKEKSVTNDDTTPKPAAPVEQAPDESTVTPTPPAEKNYGITNVEQLVAPTAPTETIDPSDKDPEAAKENTNPDNHDDTDVEAALARKTQDGKGDGDVPESDFDSFATDDVEVDQESKRQNAEIASQVLAGQFGYFEKDVRGALEDSGYNPITVMTEVNHRLSAGAPSSLEPTDVRSIAAAAIRGEWGQSESQIKQRLDGAGHHVKTVEAEMTKQLGG